MAGSSSAGRQANLTPPAPLSRKREKGSGVGVPQASLCGMLQGTPRRNATDAVKTRYATLGRRAAPWLWGGGS